jgi:hypothetical protein
VGSLRAAQAAGNGHFFSSVVRSPHPTGPACSHAPCASKAISARLQLCILRRGSLTSGGSSRTAGGPSRFETQDCAADGTADSPAEACAARSDICNHAGGRGPRPMGMCTMHPAMNSDGTHVYWREPKPTCHGVLCRMTGGVTSTDNKTTDNRRLQRTVTREYTKADYRLRPNLRPLMWQ